MIRSRKKIAHLNTEGRHWVKWAKRDANKRVRRTKNIPNGNQYRKVYEPWDIRDYKFALYTEAQVRDHVEEG